MTLNAKVQKQIKQYSDFVCASDKIAGELYTKYEVKRGLRDISGKGVLAGLTEISAITGYVMENEDLVPCEGSLFYRGYNIKELVAGFTREKRFGFEEICYLLLFGHLPSAAQYAEFKDILNACMELPEDFVRGTILKTPGCDMMNSLATSILTLYTYDERADDISIENVIRQCLQLIARFPGLMVYAYQAYVYYYEKQSLVIHQPLEELSFAQNILHMLRPDSAYTESEAAVLDLALALHAEHGGGNNSTFTTHVVTSSGTDTYSAIAASLASLKGPKHGGANIKVTQMFDDLKRQVTDTENEAEVRAYIERLVDKQVFDKAGLVYGMGHAVYSLSDPRALILKSRVEQLALEKGREAEFKLYALVERLAPKVIAEKRKMYKGVCANIDFYSGFLYRLLNLPEELFTPLFACARLAGWSAHRVEELVNDGKIIRPAYKSVMPYRNYLSMSERDEQKI